MGHVIVDMSVSIDGVIAAPGNYRLHDWYFNGDTVSAALNAELLAQTGAIILGRRTYDLGASMGGFVDNPYRVPHVVLTHTPPAEPAEGQTEFVFITQGIQQALTEAQAAAGDKAVVITGGANTVQQFLKAGLVDELYLHVVPVLMGAGTRLFDPDGPDMELTPTHVIEAPGVTHIQYHISRT